MTGFWHMPPSLLSADAGLYVAYSSLNEGHPPALEDQEDPDLGEDIDALEALVVIGLQSTSQY